MGNKIKYVIIGAIVIVSLLGGAVGILSNWLSEEQVLTKEEYLNTLQNAKTIEMKGKLNSVSDYRYIYVNGERVGTSREDGIINISWEFKNNDAILYKMKFSDETVNPNDFETYEFIDDEGKIIGYMQSSLIDSRDVLKLYDEMKNLKAYVDVEPEIVTVRTNWTVNDVNGNILYDIYSNYNTTTKQCESTINSYNNEIVNIIEVLGIVNINFDQLKKYYDI